MGGQQQLVVLVNKMNMPNLRLMAARIILDVTHGHSLSDKLDETFASIKDKRDRSFLQALCYGVCRTYPRLEILLHYLLKKPLSAKDSDLQSLLLVGLYQLIYMRTPPYAAISETVNAVLLLHKPWAKGLVNALLREYLRKKEDLDKKVMTHREAYYAHPAWWIDAIKSAWQEHWETILKANNEEPPFTLRVNLTHLSREQYVAKLSEHGQTGLMTNVPETKAGITLRDPLPVDVLPGFSTGDVSVQDGAAQLASELLDLKPNLRVLDACAAPGGKLTHFIETEPALSEVIGIDKDPERIDLIKANLARLFGEGSFKRNLVKLICHDATKVDAWFDGKLFDRILIDAPCSGSGVIRRHPDIKLLRKESDIKAYARLQEQILTALWPLLKQQGLLVYATCSIFPEENIWVLKHFLANHADAREVKIKADWGLACDIGRQILPGMHQMDGFYYAIIFKL